MNAAAPTRLKPRVAAGIVVIRVDLRRNDRRQWRTFVIRETSQVELLRRRMTADASPRDIMDLRRPASRNDRSAAVHVDAEKFPILRRGRETGAALHARLGREQLDDGADRILAAVL